MTRRFHQKRKNRPAAWIMALVAVACVLYLLYTRVFVVRKISVTGTQQVTDRAIVDQSGITMGDSIFSVKEDKIRRAFANQGLIALDEVEIRFPDTVALTVHERMCSAYVSYLGNVYLVDENVVVISHLSSLPTDTLPLVTGMSITASSEGQSIKTSVMGQTETAAHLLSALKMMNCLDGISELNVSDLDNLYLITRAGMIVKLGDVSELDQKIIWMNSVSEQLNAEGIVTGTLDVSSGESAIYSP